MNSRISQSGWGVWFPLKLKTDVLLSWHTAAWKWDMKPKPVVAKILAFQAYSSGVTEKPCMHVCIKALISKHFTVSSFEFTSNNPFHRLRLENLLPQLISLLHSVSSLITQNHAHPFTCSILQTQTCIFLCDTTEEEDDKRAKLSWIFIKGKRFTKQEPDQLVYYDHLTRKSV